MLRLRRPLVLLACILACEDAGQYRVVAHVPGGMDRAVRVDVFVIASCEDAGGADSPIAHAVADATGASALGALRPGRYGLYAVAREAGCVTYAAGCAPIEVEAGTRGTLEVFLQVVPARGCDDGEGCVSEVCVPIDGGIDGGVDAGPPAVIDGGVDAGSEDRYLDEVLADRPVGYWRLDEVELPDAVDASGNGNDGLYQDGVTLGVLGALASGNTAARFDLGNMSIGDRFDFEGSSPFSVELWIEPGQDYDGVVLAKTDWVEGKGYLGWLLVIHLADGNLVFYREDDLVRGPRLPPGEFSHVVVTFDGELLVMYVDGEELGRSTSGDSVTPTEAPLLVAGPSEWKYLAATIDEVALYDEALTEARVLAHFEAAAAR
ncbi:MAG: LamG domain-containing protein [Deltaproteobacteria bacterium]|nr:LamG domain-containing protein [Deltaproteobacteria bacterium]